MGGTGHKNRPAHRLQKLRSGKNGGGVPKVGGEKGGQRGFNPEKKVKKKKLPKSKKRLQKGKGSGNFLVGEK